MTHDYRRGRAAIGYLAGRRPTRGAAFRKRGASRVGWLVGGVAALVVAIGLIGGDTRPSGRLSPDQPIAAINGPPRPAIPSAWVVRDGQNAVLPVREARYRTWAEAASEVRFPLREPRWLPEGYWLSALQSFVPDIDGGDPTPNAVIATYSGPGRDYIVFDQFWVERLEEFDVASTLPFPPTEGDVIEVAGHRALWQAGTDESNLILVWQDGQVGYRLEGSLVDLETLIRLAGSLYE